MSLKQIRSSMWNSTSDFGVQEWTLVDQADLIGRRHVQPEIVCHRKIVLTSCRKPVSDMIGVYVNEIWMSSGNRIYYFDAKKHVVEGEIENVSDYFEMSGEDISRLSPNSPPKYISNINIDPLENDSFEWCTRWE